MRRILPPCLAALVALTAGPARAADPPDITSVTPVRAGSLLATLVRTSSLPGGRIASSLESGLPSAIELRLDLRDARDRTIAENTVFYRIAFDLWDEIFRVQGPGAERTFDDLDSLERFLEELPRLPVASIGGLEPSARHRVRVGCRLHPVAPRETERLGEWVEGEPDAREQERNASTNDREVSVSLGRIIRFFYRGSGEGDEAAERFSAWFEPASLPDVTAEETP